MNTLTRLKEKNLHRWVAPWAMASAQALWRQSRARGGMRHLLFCFCDHYEPEWGRPGPEVGEQRVRAWQERYPINYGEFRDADGRPPRHSFFFPGEEYRPPYLQRLTDLCARGYGEVELHLHHDGDSAAVLRDKIQRYLGLLAQHGHLSREGDGAGGERLRYAFIHGDWALANGNPRGGECGVDDELCVLHETGCYADFTFPSAPHPTQPRVVNSIYWPMGDLRRPRPYDQGEAARVGVRRQDRLLMVEGPLSLSLRPGTLRPRIDAAAVTSVDPPTAARVHTWVRQGIGVEGRPEWVFVKIHTHGAPELTGDALLSGPGRELHRVLRQHYNDGRRWALHYVTAREMFNVACAAMDGRSGDPAQYRDYLLRPPPMAA